MNFFSLYKHPITITKLSNFLKEIMRITSRVSSGRYCHHTHTHTLSLVPYTTPAWMIDKYLLA